MTDTEPKGLEALVSRREFLALSGSVALLALNKPSGASTASPAAAVSDAIPSADAMPDDALWEQVRSQFLIDPDLTYMNNGSVGPMPLAVVEANDRSARHLAANPIDYQLEAEREEVRTRLAAFVGADADEIAITRSTTEGMNIFAHGIDRHPGDEVLMCTHEHPGGYGAYRTLEARVRALARQLREGLAAIPEVRLWTSADSRLSAGLTSFTVGQVPMHNVARAVRERTGIYVLPMPARDLNAVRVSTHFYNTPVDVERLLSAVRRIAENELDFV